jgi:hypothetical protein
LKDEESSHNDSKPPNDTPNRASVERGKELPSESSEASTKPPVPPPNAKNDLDTDNKEKKAQTEKKCRENISVTLVETGELKKAERWAVGLGIAALVVTLAGLIVAAWTLAVFHKQFKEMQAQTKILSQTAEDASQEARTAHRQARKQIGTMQAQVAAIQRQMRQDQRAWMRLQIGMPQYIRDATGMVQLPVHVAIFNTGKTPARNILTEVVIAMVKNGEPPVFTYKDVPRARDTTGSMWQGDSYGFDTHLLERDSSGKTKARNLSAAEYQELVHTKKWIAVYGKISYVDVFGVNHWTTSCIYSLPPLPPTTEFVLVDAKTCTDYGNTDTN